MAAGDAAERLIRVDEFLTFQDGTDTRHELVDGRIIAMSPPSEAHGTIVANIVHALKKRIPHGGRVVTEAGIRPLVGSNWNFWQADVVVTCTGRARDGGGLTAPTLVVEVLSPTTEQFDRGRKARDYSALPSVRDILLVHSDDRRVELWTRQGDGWFLRDCIGDADVPLTGIGGAIPMAEFYDSV